MTSTDLEGTESDTDFDEAQTDTDLNLPDIDWSLFTKPVVIQSLAGIVISLAVLIGPGGFLVLPRLIGAGLVVLGAGMVWTSARTRPIDRLGAPLGLVAVAAGSSLAAIPDRSPVTLARLVGVLAIAATIRNLVASRRHGDPDLRQWALVRSAAVIAGATLLIAFPTDALNTIVAVAALGWIGVSLLVLMATVDPAVDVASHRSGALGIAGDWLLSRPKDVDDRESLYVKIIFEGPSFRRRLARFFALMGFASVIASMGVIVDSTAVVIGAMLIAPLMTPLMGMAISLVMGWPLRLRRSALVAVAGIGFAIMIGLVMGLTIPAVIDTDLNAQILSRTSPTTLDLITAIGAGLAGAYGLSRPDVSDSLPGVAIAISLVPPLTVVGLCFSQGDWTSGIGALLLFSTNMLAILVFGGITFILTGVTPIQRMTENQHRVRTWTATIATVGALIVGALAFNGSQLSAEFLDRSTLEDAVAAWLSDKPDHNLVQVNPGEEITTVIIRGPSASAPAAVDLADRLHETLGEPVTVDLRLIVEERDLATSSATSSAGSGDSSGDG